MPTIASFWGGKQGTTLNWNKVSVLWLVCHYCDASWWSQVKSSFLSNYWSGWFLHNAPGALVRLSPYVCAMAACFWLYYSTRLLSFLTVRAVGFCMMCQVLQLNWSSKCMQCLVVSGGTTLPSSFLVPVHYVLVLLQLLASLLILYIQLLSSALSASAALYHSAWGLYQIMEDNKTMHVFFSALFWTWLFHHPIHTTGIIMLTWHMSSCVAQDFIVVCCPFWFLQTEDDHCQLRIEDLLWDT